MIITIQEIYRDTRYFFIKKIEIIFLISVIVTCLSGIIELLIKSNFYIISIIENQVFNNFDFIKAVINHINESHTQEILIYSIFKIIELLMNKTLLLGSIITLISISSHKNKSLLLFFQFLLKLLPNLLIINIFSLCIVQISYLFFIVLGILVSLLLILAPIICSFKENNLMHSISSSIYISRKYIHIIGPVFFVWICGKFVLTTVLSHIIVINRPFSCFLLNIGINMIYSILTIYLFRFYMLLIRSINASKDIGLIV